MVGSDIKERVVVVVVAGGVAMWLMVVWQYGGVARNVVWLMMWL